MQERLLVGKREACHLLGGISQRTLDYMISRGELTPVRLGRRVMFSVKSLEQFARKDHRTRLVTAPVNLSEEHSERMIEQARIPAREERHVRR